ncbi:SRPBCC domain-containing protein [Actinoplanes sp. NPDC051470]|uniref:SRPBCC domain-containing protein n=1 Tax=unclassified Actinoplanes TaxID=2626549 RepID=UPI00342B8B3F
MTVIEADPAVPIIRVSREFRATPAALLRAHTDPDLFARWVGPDSLRTHIDHWDARTGGSYRYRSVGDGGEWAFHGCFHEIQPGRIVQTFTYEGNPDGVALETLWFDDLGDGRSRLRSQSLVDSFASRDAWLTSGMEAGLTDGHAKLERMLTDDLV